MEEIATEVHITKAQQIWKYITCYCVLLFLDSLVDGTGKRAPD